MKNTSGLKTDKRLQHPEGCRGFTLLEIMVAVAVMAIVLVSVYKLHAQTISMGASARFYTTAPLLAQAKIAEIEAFPSRRQAAGAGDFGEQYPGYDWKAEIEDVGTEIFGSAAKEFRKVEVTVTFNHNEFVYRLRTYLLLPD